MKVFRVVIEPTALEDIEESLNWLSEKAPHKVSEWLESLQFSLESLSQLPDRCPFAPENGQWGPEEVRQHLFDRYPSKYRILFVIKGDIVHILQIRHGARLWLHEE
jgi:plasmid stabilization system protein ParE